MLLAVVLACRSAICAARTLVQSESLNADALRGDRAEQQAILALEGGAVGRVGRCLMGT